MGRQLNIGTGKLYRNAIEAIMYITTTSLGNRAAIYETKKDSGVRSTDDFKHGFAPDRTCEASVKIGLLDDEADCPAGHLPRESPLCVATVLW